MKKTVLLSICLLFGIAVLFSVSATKKASGRKLSVLECPPSSSGFLKSAETFKSKVGEEPMLVRKNIDSLTQAEINAIKVGILKMKALPYTDPTSWTYQAAIHGTTMPDNLLSWNMCHRTGETFFFLAWHRMYCYFFERILRSKSGRANLTLPYWNYQVNPTIPFPYRDKSPGNPLYDATRTAGMNNGGSLPASISTAFNNALAIVPYYSFQSSLNGGPHGSVHTSIAGNMAVVNTAVKDPVFWLHHSNIDRLWEVWRSMCNGRSNPIDTAWLNKTYTFFDENGTPINMSGTQVVEISSQLNYRYDNLPPVISCPASRLSVASQQDLISFETVTNIDGRIKKTDFSGQSSAALESVIRQRNSRNFDFARPSNPERLLILFDGVNVNRMPQGVVEVYLNLPPGAAPSSNAANFVGLLDLFSAEHISTHGSSQRLESIELDATKAATALGLNLQSLRSSTVSFYTRGITLNGTEVATQAQISIRRIRFSSVRYSTQ